MAAAEEVAAHYNGRPTCGFGARRASPIFHLRNFNNWVKSTAIGEATELAGVANGGGAALDLCCGKGGDLFKWRAARVSRLVCVDIARESVADCERKFRSLRLDADAAFLTADCALPGVPVKGLHELAARPVDVCSCQFALHYSFESLPRARALLANATATLRPGGIFVGTLPDAYEIVDRMRSSPAPDGSFGNSVFRVTPMFDRARTPPLFGAKYDFHLEGVVDCPEFLVYFPALVALAEEFGLELLWRRNFRDHFLLNKTTGLELMRKMESLECVARRDLEAPEKLASYGHVRKRFETSEAERVGTVSLEEWEAATMYCVFMFRKKASPVP